jgi:predicted MPP superfamily phosphohydrolase
MNSAGAAQHAVHQPDAGMPAGDADESAVDAALRLRITEPHLRLRLGIEAEEEQRIIGQGLNLVHWENWYSFQSLLRLGLRASLLYQRGRRNARRIELTHNDFLLPLLPAALDGLKILHISDLHLDMDPEFPDVLGRRVAGLDYDLCALTGDFRYETYGPWLPAVESLERLCGYLRAPIYGILGNHDSIRMVPAMESAGVRMLMNESVPFQRRGATLYLAGVDDPHYYQADNLEAAVAQIPRRATSLLLAHSPEIYRRAAHSGFAAMLCGHTHGGQIRLPGGIPLILNANCPRRLGSGSWDYAGMLGYTSTGAGSSVLDVRFNCPAEVTLHTLRRA